MKISVITINFNNVEGLTKTIDSVLNQTYEDIEYIIIDGGSNDTSKQLIEEHAEHLYLWVSEKDSGIYNAMNKGFHKATGDYCLFLNSGDLLASNTVVKEVVNEIGQQPGFDIYYGDLILHDAKTKLFDKQLYPVELSLNYFYNTTIGHPSSFISRKLLKIQNGYSENYQIISDWLFFIQAYLGNAKFKKIPIFTSIYDIDGISANGELVYKEKRLAFEKELSNFKLDFQLFEELVVYKKSRLHNLLNDAIVFFRRRKPFKDYI